MLVASFFQAHRDARRIMNKMFKELNYGTKEKYFVFHKVLGYAPYVKELTLPKMEKVIFYLKEQLKQGEKVHA